MNKKLSSAVAALGLMASAVLPSACSETGLSIAPERQTLPSPEIELTSQYARTCIAEAFRALANPEVLCPSPLVDQLSEEYSDCLTMVASLEEDLSEETIALFAPVLPTDFDYSGSISEVQERIANKNIPITLYVSSREGTSQLGGFEDASANDYRLHIIPGFLNVDEFSVRETLDSVDFIRLESQTPVFINNEPVERASIRLYSNSSSMERGGSFR